MVVMVLVVVLLWLTDEERNERDEDDGTDSHDGRPRAGPRLRHRGVREGLRQHHRRRRRGRLGRLHRPRGGPQRLRQDIQRDHGQPQRPSGGRQVRGRVQQGAHPGCGPAQRRRASRRSPRGQGHAHFALLQQRQEERGGSKRSGWVGVHRRSQPGARHQGVEGRGNARCLIAFFFFSSFFSSVVRRFAFFFCKKKKKKKKKKK